MSETENLTGVSLKDLVWMQGSWRESSENVVREEHWSEAIAGTMVGMFRWCVGDDLRFYELITLEEQDSRILMLIRHFNRGLVPWESNDKPMEFELVRLQDREAHFRTRNTESALTLVYRLDANDRLHVFFLPVEDSGRTLPTFLFTRSSL